MFSQEDIDAVLNDAQQAVDDMADDVGKLVEPTEDSSTSTAPAPAIVAPPSQSPAAPYVAPPTNQPTDRVQRILKLRVPMLVRLAARPMPICEIIQLSPGTIIEFYRTVDCELDLMINNCIIGSGVAVKVNEHFGLRINHIGNVKQRIDTLGSGHS